MVYCFSWLTTYGALFLSVLYLYTVSCLLSLELYETFLRSGMMMLLQQEFVLASAICLGVLLTQVWL